MVKCTFWYPKKTASRLKVMAAAETYSQTPAEDMCYLLEECKEAEMVSACPKSTFWTPKCCGWGLVAATAATGDSSTDGMLHGTRRRVYESEILIRVKKQERSNGSILFRLRQLPH